MPDFRDTELKETQKEWVATTLNSFVNCEFSKISPEILSDWETLLSKTSEGNALGQCLKGKYFLNYTHFFDTVCVRTRLLPGLREVEVNETQKEWVAATMKSFVSCTFSKLSSDILNDWETLISKTSEGNALHQCLKGKY